MLNLGKAMPLHAVGRGDHKPRQRHSGFLPPEKHSKLQQASRKRLHNRFLVFEAIVRDTDT
jgi:hypothetical protein